MYPLRNSFEMKAHDAQFEPNEGEVLAEKAGLLGDLKEALAELKKPAFRDDGKLNI